MSNLDKLIVKKILYSIPPIIIYDLDGIARTIDSYIVEYFEENANLLEIVLGVKFLKRRHITWSGFG